MKIHHLILPSIVLGSAILVSTPQESHGFSLLGHSLSPNQSDFRVFNNFLDPSANNNTNTTTTFPFWGGADQAIWKGCIEWSSDPHGGGGGDPHQAELGSGDSNFDPIFSGGATSTGNIGDNVHSSLNQNGGGTFAFMQGGSFGWWIRYFENWTWNDGPGTNIGNNIDIQETACHEYGHSLGMGHSANNSATMAGSGFPGSVIARSLHADDIAGIQAIYGHRDDSGTKPRILSVVNNGGTMTIICENLTLNANQVWFTRLTPNAGTQSGDPIKVTGLVSTNGNTQLDLAIPGTAGPGDIMVKSGNAGQAGTSAPYPFDPFSVPPPVMPMIAALNKGSVQALTPTGPELVTILGTDLLTVTDVMVNGISLNNGTSFSGSFTVVSDNQIDFEMPLASAAGMLDVTVIAPGGSDTTQIDVVPASPPAMDIEQPDIVPAVGMDLALAAQPGDVIFLLFSPVLAPTTIPGVLDWEIGGGNLNLIFQLKGFSIGAQLWRKQHFGPFTGLSGGEVLHFEGWVLEIANGFASPWESTNAVSRTVTM